MSNENVEFILSFYLINIFYKNKLANRTNAWNELKLLIKIHT